ncbi:MAG: hemerythrin domain-containing protein [Pirellulales bacterium]|nr:hemerythrin domain-containing protein [Pirellulales bacterium]
MNSTSSMHCRADWSERSLAELIHHIIYRHHSYLRRELPKLNRLAQQCASHRSMHRVVWLLDLRRILSALTQELMQHINRAELVLFPWIRQIESAGSERASQRRSLIDPIAIMEQEHCSAQHKLARLRRLTNDFSLTDVCCDECRSMLAGLAELERELNQHILEENDQLFSRAKELEDIVLLTA